MQEIDTLIIGAGPAGLSLSYFLTRQQRSHLLLEQNERLAEPWRSERWDSFTLVTPNWMVNLPGDEYRGDDPDSFLTRAQIVQLVEDYAAAIQAPVRYGVRAGTVDQIENGYLVKTTAGEFRARNVVVAPGMFQKPRVPAFSASIPKSVLQIHSSAYRNPEKLPPGAVLVAGSAQSGCQIAEELYLGGRKVYLSTGASSGRIPRRYRGKDILRWMVDVGFFNQPTERLASPKMKFAGNPQASGKNGGRTLNLHQFARDGVTLLGRIIDAHEGRVLFAPDLKENLANIDGFEERALGMIDQYIEQNCLDAPPETPLHLEDGYGAPVITELDLAEAGIGTVVWALGYKFDFSWVHLPVVDEDGYPLHQRGVTAFPGLYFHGLTWQQNRKSGILFGLGDDAAFIADHLKNNR